MSKKTMKFAAFISGMLVLGACLAGCANGTDSGTNGGNPTVDESTRDANYRSFWTSDTIKNETVMLEEGMDGKITGKLLFTPTDIVSVKNFDLTIQYPMSGFMLNGNELIRTEGSTLPYMPYALADCQVPLGDGLSQYDGLLFTEGQGIVSKLILVTYTYNPSAEEWKSVPQDKSVELVHFRQKLQNREGANLFVYGDSIAAGCSASSVLNYNPRLPVWGQAVANELSAKYRTRVGYYNGSVGGWTSADGALNIAQKIQTVPESAPDLAIVAFGMNDGSGSVPADTYYTNLKTILTEIRNRAPACDIVLISTIHANPLCSQNKEITASYHAENERLAAEFGNCVTVNMSSFSQELYERKTGFDLLANNINHPNDFLVRCYVMNLLDTIEGNG